MKENQQRQFEGAAQGQKENHVSKPVGYLGVSQAGENNTIAALPISVVFETRWEGKCEKDIFTFHIWKR